MKGHNPSLAIELSVEHSTPNPDDAIILAARGDKMSEGLIGKSVDDVLDGGEDAKADFLERLFHHGHWGPAEHPQAVIFVEGLSYVAHAYLVRHRHMSFDVRSQRYVRIEDAEVVVPESIQGEPAAHKAVETAISAYHELVEDGFPKEDARYILPQGVTVNLTMSANARSLMHWVHLREKANAHWEARQLADLICGVFEGWAPKTYNAFREANLKGTSP